ncbi:MAG: DUF721 domain-containing protein [Gammaproteobacteria bacterium]|nr:DUF721 domain-containing protein [Gammaproteobacteria bacterium]
MPSPKPKNIDNLSVNAEGSLKYIFDNLSKIRQLDHIVKEKLHTNLGQHCRVINFRDNIIVIAAESSSWATRLKFESSELLSNLRSDGFPSLVSIKIVVSETSNNSKT